MAQLEFRCERCGKLLRANAPGDTVTCENCQAPVTAPQVTPPRPAPQAASQPRPMPVVAVGGPGRQAVPAPEPVELEEEGDTSSALAAMSFLMPWAISIVFHIGLLLVLMFYTFLKEAEFKPEELLVPANRYSEKPGEPKPSPQKRHESASPTRPSPQQVAPEVVQKSDRIAPDKPIPQFSGANSADSLAFTSPAAGAGSKFFGTQSGGNVTKIAYVVDCSGSMYNTIDYVKAELRRSITELIPKQSFTVIFFEIGVDELDVGGKQGLQPALAPTKRAAIEWAKKKVARSVGGSTDPRKALERAFATSGGPPQCIFILSDGWAEGISAKESLDAIRKLNKDQKVRINTILFNDKSTEPLMRAIAQENGGEYKFLSMEDLARDYN